MWAMSPSLDVLVTESHAGAAAEAEAILRNAGHRTHRCYDPESQGFPCKGLLKPDGCPLDHGIDVALLARRRVLPTPSSLENGVICAIRAGIPVAERGPEVLDPFAPWVSARFEDTADVVDACEQAVVEGLEPLRHHILDSVNKTLTAAGAESGALGCTIERQGSRLIVRLSGPAVAERLRQAAAVEAVAAVHRAGVDTDPLDVSYTAGA
jgi:hypothetical protein